MAQATPAGHSAQVTFDNFRPHHLHQSAHNALARVLFEMRSDATDYALAAQQTNAALDAIRALASVQHAGGVQ